MTPAPLPIKDKSLLEEALTHRSYLNENRSSKHHNERLEFLGDAVLELAVSEFLYHRFPAKPEGELTAYRASLVRTSTLAKIANLLNLGQRLQLSKGEELTGGRTNQSLLANTFEAVIGALYLDQGFSAVTRFLTVNLFPQLDDIITQKLFKDYKSTLQELVQAQGQPSPEYSVITEAGPDHNKEFVIGVSVKGRLTAQGKGRSKQTAQQEAARLALEKLGSA